MHMLKLNSSAAVAMLVLAIPALAGLAYWGLPPSAAPEAPKLAEPAPVALATAASLSLLADRVTALERRMADNALRADVDRLKAAVEALTLPRAASRAGRDAKRTTSSVR